MRSLPAYEAPIITKKRGIVEEASESYRLARIENGISKELVHLILEKGSDTIQIQLLAHKEITREIVLDFADNGGTKKVKNRAKNKLNNKGLRPKVTYLPKASIKGSIKDS